MVNRYAATFKKVCAQIWDFFLSQSKDRQFLRAGSLLILSYGIVTLLGLIRTPVIVWVIPKDQVGMLAIVAAWMPFLQLVSLSGLDTSSYHYTSKGQPWSFVVNISYRLRWSLVSAAGFLTIAIYYFWQHESSLAWLFIIAGISYPFTAGLSSAAGMLGAQERYKHLFWYRIFESLTDFAGFIPLLFSAYWVSQIVTFYGANQLATLIMQVSFVAWLLIPLLKNKENRLSKQEEQEVLRYGKHQTAINGLSVLNNRIDALLVGIFLPFTSMADYSISLLFFEQFKRLWNIYLTVRYPKLVRLPIPERRRQFIHEGIIVFFVFSIGGAILALAAFWLLPIILPPSYANSILLIFLMIVAFLVSLPANMVETYFRTQQNQRSQYYLRIVGILSSVTFSLLLLPRWGVFGVAGGKVMASIMQSIFASLLFIKDPQKLATRLEE
jgi:O-antigen/teichoic acid export membrane protein